LPFLLLDQANSVANGPEGSAIGGGSESQGPGLEGFSRRASAWTVARSDLLEDNTELAVALAAESRTTLEAEAIELAADQRKAEEARAAPARLDAARREGNRRPASASGGAPTAASAPTAAPSDAQWAALRRCESGGNYQIVSGSGRYRGAYQFKQSTWDVLASGVAPHLVGVDPAAASPADQDLLARSLFQMQGASPWPTCGTHLRS
jgi:hypothetical protein